MNARLIAASLAFCVSASPALSADGLKIGVITTLSGSSGVIGKHVKEGADLALEQLGGKMSGREVELIYGDDQGKPDVARQIADEMLKKHKVDFFTGVNWSNVLLAIYQPIIKSGKILVTVSAGPQEVAGAMCAPNFFAAGWQNDNSPEAQGKRMQDAGITDVYVLAPNYAGGRDVVAGFKRYFKGRIAGEAYTRFDQTDYQTELTAVRAANPKAVFVFYPGGLGIQFFKQYDQAGLRTKIPLYSVYSANEVTLPAIGEAAEGIHEAGWWAPDLQTPGNQKFVAAFRKKYGALPSEYAASTYDAINLIDSGVRGVKGKIANTKGMIAAMEKVDFASVRGKFTYNTNHFPIQNFYALKIAKGSDGAYIRQVEGVILPDHKDAYYEKCQMKK